jgi:hypothetical protein
MSQQRQELEEEVTKLLQQKNIENNTNLSTIKENLLAQYENKIIEKLKNQSIEFQNKLEKELLKQKNEIETDLQAQFYNKLSILRMEQNKFLIEETQPILDKITSEIIVLNNTFDEASKPIQKSRKIHYLSSIILAIELAISSNKGSELAKNFEILKSIYKEDGNEKLIFNVLNALPKNVFKDGALSNMELQGLLFLFIIIIIIFIYYFYFYFFIFLIYFYLHNNEQYIFCG